MIRSRRQRPRVGPGSEGNWSPVVAALPGVLADLARAWIARHAGQFCDHRGQPPRRLLLALCLAAAHPHDHIAAAFARAAMTAGPITAAQRGRPADR